MVEPVYVEGVLMHYRYRGYVLWKCLRDEWQVFLESDFFGKPFVLYSARTMEEAVAYVDGRCV